MSLKRWRMQDKQSRVLMRWESSRRDCNENNSETNQIPDF